MKKMNRIIALPFFVGIAYTLLLIISHLNSYMSTRTPTVPSNRATHTMVLVSPNRMTTIVTAYFPFKKAKHHQHNYYRWLRNILTYIDNPIVIFTSVEQYSLLNSLRTMKTNKIMSTVFILNFSSPLEMPPIKRLKNIFMQQLTRDPEKVYHTIDLYSVWCAKSFMLNVTSSLNPFGSKYFLWIDAGSFRSSKYRFINWPDPQRISSSFNGSDKILLGLISSLNESVCSFRQHGKLWLLHSDIIEGGIIGGSLSSIQWWTKLFYQTVDDFIEMNEFIGKDQHIMNFIALRYSQKINVITTYKVFCDNPWFSYGPLFANDRERSILFGEKCKANDIKSLVQPLDKLCAQVLSLS